MKAATNQFVAQRDARGKLHIGDNKFGMSARAFDKWLSKAQYVVFDQVRQIMYAPNTTAEQQAVIEFKLLEPNPLVFVMSGRPSAEALRHLCEIYLMATSANTADDVQIERAQN